MDKKHFVIEAVLAVAIIVLFILHFGCAKSSCKTSTPVAVSQAKGEAGAMPIAYVRMDTLMSQYTYYQAVMEKLQKQADEHRVQLASKANALQKAAQEFERRMRTNAFISAEAQQKEQTRLLQMQQNGQQLEAELTQKFAAQQQLMLADVQKAIKEQIEEYNKSHGYAIILSNVGLDNILYAQETMDITDDVVKYLNDRYKADNGAVPAEESAKK